MGKYDKMVAAAVLLVTTTALPAAAAPVINGPIKPINLTQVITNLVTGSATIEGVIAMVGTNHFAVMGYNNRYTLIFLKPGSTLPVQLYPGGHIVATVMPGQANTNTFTLAKINRYDGIDPTQPGSVPVTPPVQPSIIPQLPVLDTTTGIPGL